MQFAQSMIIFSTRLKTYAVEKPLDRSTTTALLSYNSSNVDRVILGADVNYKSTISKEFPKLPIENIKKKLLGKNSNKNVIFLTRIQNSPQICTSD